MQDTILTNDTIIYAQTHSFSKIAIDLHQKAEHLNPFVNRFFSIQNFAAQIAEKKKQTINRAVLVEVLQKQYAGVKTKEQVIQNIDKLALPNTFTITTGHQLCLFTGPLYFIYKIAHTIKLATKLAASYPNENFVPVFWMASEDHDFEEVASTNINGKKIVWTTQADEAPVGRLVLNNVQQAIDELIEALGDGPSALEIKKLLEKSYREEHNLSRATRLLVNELFGKHGLLILDADDHQLKNEFAPVIAKELKEGFSFEAITKQTEELSQHYKPQISGRPINLFLFEKGQRKRIEKTASGFKLAETNITYSLEELLDRLAKQAEDFSPNVALRPLYQECILPNLAYIGGGGELAYWLQLKSIFEAVSIPFPILSLRNSVLLVESDQVLKMQKLEINTAQLFLPENDLVRALVNQLESPNFYRLQEERSKLQHYFEELSKNTSEKTNSLRGHIESQWQKNNRFLLNLENKLYRIAKNKHERIIHKVHQLKSELFPNGSLQERTDNIFSYVHRYGIACIDELIEQLNPENEAFTIVYLKHK